MLLIGEFAVLDSDLSHLSGLAYASAPSLKRAYLISSACYELGCSALASNVSLDTKDFLVILLRVGLSHLYWVELCSPEMHVLLKPQSVTLLGTVSLGGDKIGGKSVWSRVSPHPLTLLQGGGNLDTGPLTEGR